MQVISVKHDNMTLKDRVKKLRKENHYSQVELAKELHVSQSVVSLIESGNASVSIEILKKLGNLFDKSCDWLIYGKDTYVKVTPDNAFIPFIKVDAKAGYIQNVNKSDFLETLDMYKIPGFGKGDYRIFEVEGDSMIPALQPADRIVCELVTDIDEIIEGTMNVVVLKKDIVVKRFYHSVRGDGKVTLRSDNPAYKDIQLSREQIMEVWKVKTKITDSFVASNGTHYSRVDQMEEEMKVIKDQLAVIIDKFEN